MNGAPLFDGPLDLVHEHNVQDPFPLFAWLRENAPGALGDSLGGFLLTRYDDVLEVFDRLQNFSSDRFRLHPAQGEGGRAPVRAVSRVLRDWLVFRDPPDHTRLRALLQKSFTPRQLEKNRWGIQKTIDDLLDRVAERGEMDFVRDFAFPLPATVICILLGVPTRDVSSIKLWSDRLASYLGGSIESPDTFAEAEEANRHLSFSFGIHFCLGAPLARLESALAFETLLQRLPELSASPGRFKPRLFLRGLESLALRWDPARAR